MRRDELKSTPEAQTTERPCTCHPSEAPVPCPQKYAYSECIAHEMATEKTTEPKPPKHAEEDWRHPPCGICGGEPKKFEPQRIRRVIDGVIIVEYVQ